VKYRWESCTDILIVVYHMYHLIFSVPVLKGSDSFQKIKKGLMQAPSTPLEHAPGAK
jgi:hypothetical protein